jgi:hypothetical protein
MYLYFESKRYFIILKHPLACVDCFGCSGSQAILTTSGKFQREYVHVFGVLAHRQLSGHDKRGGCTRHLFHVDRLVSGKMRWDGQETIYCQTWGTPFASPKQ